jgi:VWFA-related protein
MLKGIIFALVVFASSTVLGQQPQQSKPAKEPDDVVRVNTELVQTDLMVLDRSGRFVEGLAPDQFQLSVDGKLRPFSFLELVHAGSAAEAAKARAASNINPAASAPTVASNDQGRVIFFFLDDLHLSESSLIRARKALTEFVENQMSGNDQVAIVSASGQIGFLQQLTDYRPMLRAAIDRLSYRRPTEPYVGKVPISEYQATQVADHNDRDLLVYLVLATINEYQAQGPLRKVAANMVQNRVRQIASQSKATMADTLDVLESLMQSSAALPGRKLVFLISDGFIADARSSNALTLLKRVTDMAARAGVIVYAMDARGTVGDPAVDAGRNDFPDGLATGTQARQPSTENVALQQPLHIIAEDTGGRAILGSNSFKDAFRQAVDETASYYLLGWRPDTDEQRGGKSRIKITIKDRSDLRVRLRNNYYVPPKQTKQTEVSDAAEKTPEIELLTALGAAYPRRTIPTALSAGYVNTADQGLLLRATMQIDRTALNETSEMKIDVIGAAVDDRGIIVTFKQVLTITPDPAAQNQTVVWNQQLKLQPGLYQVRVAVRDRESGYTGSAQQWIEVPDLASGKLQMSSLFLGERKATPADERFASPRAIAIDVDHRFARTSVLRFQTYVYNAAKGAMPPEVEIQARVLKSGKTVMSLAAARVPTDTTKDLVRLPYWAEIALDQLPPGHYTLQVTATDRLTKTAVSQASNFTVE